MRVTKDIIQQLVVETVASQDNEVVGVLVIAVGKDSLSVGGIGATPGIDDFSQAIASFARHDMPSTTLH